ncbi:predicted protein [Arabidopsis lyrata subsp. lyrata]|uniref:Predicted protein n=1 Tax=Arabidopsis lyrata subsp. lyrata TaxID=81972 RepID=D7M8Y1_ARALL|nr:predicted protein [Arabidopsis lyrata subsp. lyrata]
MEKEKVGDFKAQPRIETLYDYVDSLDTEEYRLTNRRSKNQKVGRFYPSACVRNVSGEGTTPGDENGYQCARVLSQKVPSTAGSCLRKLED